MNEKRHILSFFDFWGKRELKIGALFLLGEKTMHIFIMRHGEAEYVGKQDSQRALTEKGKLQAFRQGQTFVAQHLNFDKVLVSPFLRAVETFAQVDLAFHGTLKSKMEKENALVPDGNEQGLLDYLQILWQENVENVLLISHLPLVAEITFLLTQGKFYPNFPTAHVEHIQWDGKKGERQI